VNVSPPSTVVLDTNVVLDWLVFRDPATTALEGALASGRLRWLATPAMEDELMHVLRRGLLAAWTPDLAHIDAQWRRWAVMLPAEPVALPGMRCTDPDDQKFIDLAVQVRATALLSKDRAVLRLARRARSFGIDFAPAGHWLRQHTPS
jgi:predicted nucleic acid-binding protein